MKKKTVRQQVPKATISNTVPINLTMSELEVAYSELAFVNGKKPKVLNRVIAKLRNALLARVLEQARRT